MTIGSVSITSASSSTPYQSTNWKELFNWDEYWHGITTPIAIKDYSITHPREIIHLFKNAVKHAPKPELEQDVTAIVRAIENASKEEPMPLIKGVYKF